MEATTEDDLAQEPVPLEPPSRWEVELEFVQSLANPMYVNFLGQNKYLQDPAFLNYLEYLEYWRKPENVQFIVYPNCLHMLTLLKEPAFRREICKADVAQLIMDSFFHKWNGQAEQEPENSTDMMQRND